MQVPRAAWGAGMTTIELDFVNYFRERCGDERAENVRSLIEFGMIVAQVGREDEPVRWMVTEKGRRALDVACDRERAL